MTTSNSQDRTFLSSDTTITNDRRPINFTISLGIITIIINSATLNSQNALNVVNYIIASIRNSIRFNTRIITSNNTCTYTILNIGMSTIVCQRSFILMNSSLTVRIYIRTTTPSVTIQINCHLI